jgi:hypothetical protein
MLDHDENPLRGRDRAQTLTATLRVGAPTRGWCFLRMASASGVSTSCRAKTTSVCHDCWATGVPDGAPSPAGRRRGRLMGALEPTDHGRHSHSSGRPRARKRMNRDVDHHDRHTPNLTATPLADDTV